TQLRNVGKLENKGIELSVNTDNITGVFSWSSSFNISFNRNKITNLNGQVLEAESYASRYVNRGLEGEPVGIFYTNEYAGVNLANGRSEERRVGKECSSCNQCYALNEAQHIR